MKNYSRIYGVIMVFISGLFIFFEIATVSFSFRMDMEGEIDMLKSMNQEYSHTLINSIEMLEDHGDQSQSVLKFLAENIYSGMANQKVVYEVLNSEGSIYSSRLLDLDKRLINLPNGDGLYLEYHENAEANYITITGQILIDEQAYYISTSLEVTDVYRQRDSLISRYSVLVLIVLILLAFGLWLIVKSFEKNVRISEKMEQLEVTSRKQEEFSASFAHECKTPLTSIIGYSDLLLTMDLDQEEERQSLNYIRSEGKRLERLTNQMMVLTNLRDEELGMEAVAVMPLMKGIENLVSEKMQKKRIDFTMDYEAAYIRGVEDLYVSLVVNILDNARKAVKEKGHIHLVGQQKKSVYLITITDDGCGMSSEVIEKMMEPFYMEDKSRTRREGGAGLGMSIVNRIAKSLDVLIEVTSQQGGGSRFTLTIPLDKEAIRRTHISHKDGGI